MSGNPRRREVRALTLGGGLTGYILDYDEPVPLTPS